jgi:hypothetical protein
LQPLFEIFASSKNIVMSDFYNKKIDFKAIKIDEKLSRVKKQKKIKLRISIISLF